MCAISSLAFALLAVLLSIQPAHSQQQGNAQLRFVCATGVEGALSCSVDGTSLRPAGLPSGYRTGLIDFSPGICKIEAEHPTLGKVSFSVDLKPGNNKSIIFFSEEKETKENTPSGAPSPAKKQLRHFILDAQPGEPQKSFLTVLQLTPSPVLNVQIFSNTLPFERFKPTADHTDSDHRTIRHEGRTVCMIEMSQEPVQEYQLILFKDTDGSLQAIHNGTR